MAYYDIRKQLSTMAAQQTKYAPEVCNGIIDAIMGHYMITPGYYGEHCIATFRGFLDNGELTW